MTLRGYLAYFGTPLYESGRLAAHLLTERRRKEDVDKVITDFLLFHKKPELIDNYMHMDILTRFNEDYY